MLVGFTTFAHQNQYLHFKALALSAEGEDRRGQNLTPGRALVRAQPPYSRRLGAMGLMNKEMAYAWIYDRMAMEQWPAEGEEKRFSGVTAIVPNLKPGKYRVEVWNTKTGEIISENEQDSNSGGKLSIKLPEFETDCALKIKYRD